MLRRQAFWWGTSVAFLPAFLGFFAVAYSGMAGVNALWHLLMSRDSPGLVMVLGGVLYGLSFGVLLPCLLLGAAGHLTWQLASHRLAPLLSKATSGR